MVRPRPTIGAPMAQASLSADIREPMDLFKAMRRRRMHRLFTDEPVSRELLAKLVYAAASP
jgi:hypothetical protein